MSVEDMPHILVCRYQTWAEAPARLQNLVRKALLEKHMMFRIVCPWDGTSGLRAGDIVIVGDDIPESKINAELVRLRAAGCKAERIPFLALMGDIRVS